MGSRHLVDPELLANLDSNKAELSMEQLDTIRSMGGAALAALETPEDAPGIAVSRAFAPGAEGAPDVPLLVFSPKVLGPARPAVLFIHGGGFFMGTEHMFQMRNRRLARDLDVVVVSVGYRLPPEYPHPAPVEDCYAALRWLHANASSHGVDPSRIAIYGESAGAGLAAALALLARDRGEFPIAYQILSAPMLDDRTSVRADQHPFTGEFNWTRPANDFGWRCLLGHEPGRDGVSCYASPARAMNLAGLPPAFIHLGAIDLFLDEAVDYAMRLTRAGVATELHVYPGVPHSYVMSQNARVTRVAERNIFDALRVRFGLRTR